MVVLLVIIWPRIGSYRHHQLFRGWTTAVTLREISVENNGPPSLLSAETNNNCTERRGVENNCNGYPILITLRRRPAAPFRLGESRYNWETGVFSIRNERGPTVSKRWPISHLQTQGHMSCRRLAVTNAHTSNKMFLLLLQSRDLTHWRQRDRGINHVVTCAPNPFFNPWKWKIKKKKKNDQREFDDAISGHEKWWVRLLPDAITRRHFLANIKRRARRVAWNVRVAQG